MTLTSKIAQAYEDRHMLDDFVKIIHERIPRLRCFNGPMTLSKLLLVRDSERIRRFGRRMIPLQNWEFPAYQAQAAACVEFCEARRWKRITEEFQAIHDRAWRPTDYQISGIARPEFSPEVKEALRADVRAASDYCSLSNILRIAGTHGRSGKWIA